jgi:hypothetical protein
MCSIEAAIRSAGTQCPSVVRYPATIWCPSWGKCSRAFCTSTYDDNANKDEEDGNLVLEDDKDNNLAVIGSGDEDKDEDVYALEIEV